MSDSNHEQDFWKEQAGQAAADHIQSNMVVGLGTGSTANAMITALAARIRNDGLHITAAIPSSPASGNLAARLGIPVSDLEHYPELDIYIDGADEVDPALNLLKGAGGALLREKVCATAARSFLVIADSTKLVTQLGTNFPVPVEVIPFALPTLQKQLLALGATPELRVRNNQPFTTDNHNLILDCTFPNGIANPSEINARLHTLVGVVAHGLFLHMAHQAIIAGPDGVKTLQPTPVLLPSSEDTILP